MTTLTLIPGTTNKFKSLGIRNDDKNEYDESALFPKNSVVKLTKGKFPLTDYRDLYRKSCIFHIFNNKEVKLVGFCISSTEKYLGQYGSSRIVVKSKSE